MSELAVGAVQALPSHTWLNWLQSQVDTEWLPGQWIHARWLFTADPDDPVNTAKICIVERCRMMVGKSRMCMPCQKARAKSGAPLEEFVRSHTPVRHRIIPIPEHLGRPKCVVQSGDRRCQRTALIADVCRSHHNLWCRGRGKKWDQQLSVKDWVQTADLEPFDTVPPDCLVDGCSREAGLYERTLCDLHAHRYRPHVNTTPVKTWVRTQHPKVGVAEFTMIHLDERLRWEILYGLQRRVARGGKIEPPAVRKIIAVLREQPSLTTLTEHELLTLSDSMPGQNNKSLIFEVGRELRRGYDEFSGRQAADRLVWDMADVDIDGDTRAFGGRRRYEGLDFGLISQEWLRRLAMDWCLEQTSSRYVRAMQRTAVKVSGILDERPDQGLDPSKLGTRDAEAIVTAIRGTIKSDGTALGMRAKWRLYWDFFNLIEYGRQLGRFDDMPTSFAASKLHSLGTEERSERIGKDIPSFVQRQLDARIATLGSHVEIYAGLDESTRCQLFQTAYIVLRDTGRRPIEVTSLKLDCVDRDENGPVLVYDDHKNKVLGRRLPILESTADAIEGWRRVRPSGGDDTYLFPPNRPRAIYLEREWLSQAIRRWVDTFDRLDSGDFGDDGEPLPFDRLRIYPYAFRHSYAQRHADSGVPVDVLRDLMGHTRISSTSCYYTITADRKRAAIQAVGELAIDRQGNPAPLTESQRYEVNSVAVPFGNCIEPSNVKAGGRACPIRFQCAGCGFYRPDPSFIPAIEQQLNELRADRETAEAMDSAQFVIDNISAQIREFENVLSTMRDRLGQLDEHERNRIDDAAAVMRKVRAGQSLPIIRTNGQWNNVR